MTKTILVLSNHHSYTYNLRKETIQAVLDKGYYVHVVVPYGSEVEKLKEMGCGFTDSTLKRHGVNPFEEIKLLINYYKIINKIKPTAILSYTIKPNLYGGFIAQIKNVPQIANITGLGNAVANGGIITKLFLFLYRFSFRKIDQIFFQNEQNLNIFKENKIGKNKYTLIPGSGINIHEYPLLPYPNGEKKVFAYLGRIMKSKGIIELMDAFLEMKNENVLLRLVGFIDGDIRDEINSRVKKSGGCIEYHDFTTDTRKFILESHAIINPSYHEGMSNVLLEAACSGRPVLASNIFGCKEIVQDGINGFVFEPKSSSSIVSSVRKFINLSTVEMEEMGSQGRNHVLVNFDRQIVVDTYLDIIEEINEFT